MILDDAPQEAVDEYLRLREAHYHLVNHLRATKIQTEATVSGLKSLLDEIKPNTPAHLTRRSLE
jgi:adenosine deaminase